MKNNRETKFRVWDKDGKFFFIDKEVLAITMDGKILDLKWETLSLSSGLVEQGFGATKQKIILQQYTGLKDRNGKEIYEGDIIECEYGLGQVVFEEGMFILGGKKYPKGMNITSELNEIDSEIIGNIYENKELLKIK